MPFVLLVLNKQFWMLQMVTCIALKVEEALGSRGKREITWVSSSTQNKAEVGAAAGNVLPRPRTQTAPFPAISARKR